MSVNRELAFMRHMFRLAVEWNHALANPLQGIKMAKETPRLRFLSDEEVSRLIQELEQEPVWFRVIVIIALYSGMRRLEILSLKWSQVDFREGIIRVERSKNEKPRQVPMHTEVKNILSMLQRESDFLFPGHAKMGHIWTIDPRWRKLLKRAGIRDFRFHDLRHTFASHMAMSGVDIRVLQEILLGHKRIEMTMRYSHLTTRSLKKGR
ncbi:MAG: site-specific integrase [candidate division WOR-3 bacterium]